MAKLKIRNKTVDDIKAVEIHGIANGYLYLSLNMQDDTQQKRKVKLTPENKLLIEVKGAVETLKVSNCVTIYGDVQSVEAGNCCHVEGYVKDFPKEQSVQVDRKIKVCHGNEERKRNALEHDFSYSEVQFDTIQIEGDLTSLSDKSGLEIVIHGRVGTAQIGNCAAVKGTVDFASAGNRIFCTMGDSNAKLTEELLQEEEKRKKEVEESFADFFGGELKTINAFMN